MPRPRKPEAFPKAFYEMMEELASKGRIEVPCGSESQAYGLRAMLYNFFKSLRQGSKNWTDLRDSLMIARKLNAATDDYELDESRLRAAEVELGAIVAQASEVTIRIEGLTLVVLPKGETIHAKLITAALTKKPTNVGQAAAESAARLMRELEGGS